MRKLLLSLMCLLSVTLVASADSYTIEFAEKTGAQNGTQVTTVADIVKQASQSYVSNVTATQIWVTNNDYGVRIGTGKASGSLKLTLATAQQVVPTSVVIKTAAYDANPSVTVNGNALTYKNTSKNTGTPTYEEITVPGISTTQALTDITIANSAKSKRFWVKSITVNYNGGGGQEETVAAPTISCTNNTVTITATDADAIYYTTNGTEPTAASTAYTAPFAITNTVTVKAIAKKGDKLSSVTTFTATYVDPTLADKGTEANPYTVAEAIAVINSGNIPSTEVYVTGIISKLTDISTQYGNATYDISDDGQTTAGQQLTVFRGKYLEGASISDANKDEFKVGYIVVVKGTLKNYNGTPEVNTGNVLISITKPQVDVEAPQISCTDNAVTITCATDGAAIYYTTDGSEPTSASTLYNGTFNITANTTVKAVAIKDGKSSAVTSATFIFSTNYANFAKFADAYTANGADTPGTVNGPIRVTYHNGQNLYVYDTNDRGMLLYNAAGTTTPYANGTQFADVKGTYTLFGTGKVPEIINYTLGTESTGDAVVPEEPGLDELSTDEGFRYKFVKFMGVTISEIADKNFKISDADGNTIAGRNKFGITVAEGTDYDITGILDIYSGAIQLYPTVIEGGVEAVADPVFTPASGSALRVGDEITITCATDGATIYYTTNGEDPTEASTVYSGSFLFDGSFTTVKAFAVLEGHTSSKIVTATYTELAEDDNIATFDFTSLEKFNEMASIAQATAPESGKGINLNQSEKETVTFVKGVVKLVATKGSNSSNGPRWWYYNGNNGESLELRAYKSNVLTFSTTQDNFAITKIEFVASTSNGDKFGSFTATTNIDGDNGSYANNTKTWTTTNQKTTGVILTHAENGENSYISKINVTYVAAPGVTGIDGIGEDAVDANAPVEYFNLQGIRVNAENLTPGIYIRRQGSKTIKVLVK